VDVTIQRVTVASSGQTAQQTASRVSACMSETKTDTFSQYYRNRAKECREMGSLFRDPQARAKMFKLAIDYDIKAKEAESNERETSIETELRKLIGLAGTPAFGP